MDNQDPQMLDTVLMERTTTTLAELAGINLDDVKEQRFSTFPAGNFVWEVIAEPNPPGLAKIKDKAGAQFYLKCLNVLNMKDVSEAPDGDPTKLIGKVHRETLFITTGESLGYIKAFLVDIGMKASGDMLKVMQSSVGRKFAGKIIHRPNKDDKDAPPYVNIDRTKLIPMA